MDLKDIQDKNKVSQSSEQNQDNQDKKKMGFLLGMGILFMPYFFSWFTLKKGYSNTARGLSFAWAFFIIIGAMNGGQNKDGNRTIASVAKTETKVEPKKEFISETCNQLSHTFGASSKLSDIQKKEAWKSFNEKSFKWDLIVTEVSEKTLGSGYQVQFKCKGSNSLIQDIIVYYPESTKDSVMKLQKDSTYTVSGELSDYNSILGLTAESL